jgi:hypothetical protein
MSVLGEGAVAILLITLSFSMGCLRWRAAAGNDAARQDQWFVLAVALKPHGSAADTRA